MIPTIKNYCFLWYKSKGIVFLCLGLLWCLVGCSEAQPQDKTNLRIGVALYDQGDTFISNLGQNMERLAQETEIAQEIKITLSMADGKRNQTTQMDQIDQFIAQQCDVICVNIVDRTAAAVLIDKAAEASIPLIFFNRQPVDEDMQRWNQVYYIGAKGMESGQMQGRIIRDLWREDTPAVDINGDGILQYVMLEGEPGHQDTLLRTQYVVSTLTATGIQVKKLAGGTANWNRGQASAKMTQWLDELDEIVEVVIANNDDMALGAIDAYLAEGYSPDNLPLVVGVDAIPEALLALEAGTLSGTVVNDGENMAQNMLNLALALWRGTPPNQAVELEEGRYVWLPHSPILPTALEANSESELLENG